MTEQKPPNPPNQSALIVLLLVAIFLFVCFIALILRPMDQTPPLPPILTVGNTLESNPNLNVRVSILKTICLDTEKIDYSLVELSIDGGTPPYDLTITNSNLELSGPYLIATNNFRVRIKVYGGDEFTASVRSKIGEFWTGTIGLPFEAQYCKATSGPTLNSADTKMAPNTPVPANTEIIAITPVPANTETLVASSTATSVIATQTNPAVTATKTPKPAKTNIAPSPHSTATSNHEPSKTPEPQPTDTPHPQPTNTSAPPPTVIIPNPKECEDGADNDGDKLVDYPNDPQCTRGGDPHENR